MSPTYIWTHANLQVQETAALLAKFRITFESDHVLESVAQTHSDNGNTGNTVDESLAGNPEKPDHLANTNTPETKAANANTALDSPSKAKPIQVTSIALKRCHNSQQDFPFPVLR